MTPNESVQLSDTVMSAVLDALPDAVFLVDRGGRILLASDKVEPLLSYTPTELAGQNLALILGPDSPPLGTLLDSSKSAFQNRYELTLVDRMGASVPVRLYLSPVAPDRTRGGPMRDGVVALSARDVRPIRSLIDDAATAAAEKKKNHELMLARDRLESALKDLKQTQAQLIQSGKLAALGEVTSGMAHELNNPLTILQGYVERIRSELRRPEDRRSAIRKVLESIDANIGRMSRIIRHVMAFSRQAEPERNRIAVNESIAAALSLFHSQLEQRGIHLEVELSPEPVEVLADRFQLEQVFINLLANSRDAIVTAGRAGASGRIRVRSFRDGGKATVEIEDNGCGIPFLHQERIFDPFFTTKDVGQGTGLGLSISHGIISKHEGSISFESVPNEGALFRILLPALSPLPGGLDPVPR